MTSSYVEVCDMLRLLIIVVYLKWVTVMFIIRAWADAWFETREITMIDWLIDWFIHSFIHLVIERGVFGKRRSACYIHMPIFVLFESNMILTLT